MFYKCIGIIRNKLNTGCQVKIKDVGFVQPCGENKSNPYFTSILREDTHKKSFFFVVGPIRVKDPPRPTSKIPFLSLNPAFLAQKLEKKKVVKIRFRLLYIKKKVAWTTKPLV